MSVRQALILLFASTSSSAFSFATASSFDKTSSSIPVSASLMTLGASSAAASVSAATDTISYYLDDVPMGPPDAILGIAQAFRTCTDERKVNVCVGAYRDENGQPWVLPSVRAAELKMMQDGENKEYLPIEGDAQFIEKALQFAYGSGDDAAPLERLAAVQTLSGTGACRIGGTFLARFLPATTKIYIPVPTWGNHWNIMADAGLAAEPYRYYSRATNGLDYDGMMQDIEAAEDGMEGSLYLDAKEETYCLFDSAYQGFASGDAEQDAFSLRYFCSQNVPVLLAQSFAKNFGLYGERCGTFSILCSSPEQKEKVMSQLKLIVRPMYSSPPKHGSSIVKTVLSNEALTADYYQECKSMADRILEMRSKFVQALAAAGSTHDWSHVTNQIGMFAFTGMSPDMVTELTDTYAIYLTKDGRISVAGLNDGNVDYVAKAVHAVTDGKSITAA
ncbi:Aminotransferase class I and II [Fragilaria crotonensis]|nr:Aminotransferase class I and II [Fragilaria crotonensis]